MWAVKSAEAVCLINEAVWFAFPLETNCRGADTWPRAFRYWLFVWRKPVFYSIDTLMPVMTKLTTADWYREMAWPVLRWAGLVCCYLMVFTRDVLLMEIQSEYSDLLLCELTLKSLFIWWLTRYCYCYYFWCCLRKSIIVQCWPLPLPMPVTCSTTFAFDTLRLLLVVMLLQNYGDSILGSGRLPTTYIVVCYSITIAVRWVFCYSTFIPVHSSVVEEFPSSLNCSDCEERS